MYLTVQALVLRVTDYNDRDALLNVLTRDQILSDVWGYDYMGDTNVVDVYIRYLRQKLDDRFDEKYIYTMRGVGYVIKD